MSHHKLLTNSQFHTSLCLEKNCSNFLALSPAAPPFSRACLSKPCTRKTPRGLLRQGGTMTVIELLSNHPANCEGCQVDLPTRPCPPTATQPHGAHTKTDQNGDWRANGINGVSTYRVQPGASAGRALPGASGQHPVPTASSAPCPEAFRSTMRLAVEQGNQQSTTRD